MRASERCFPAFPGLQLHSAVWDLSERGVYLGFVRRVEGFVSPVLEFTFAASRGLPVCGCCVLTLLSFLQFSEVLREVVKTGKRSRSSPVLQGCLPEGAHGLRGKRTALAVPLSAWEWTQLWTEDHRQDSRGSLLCSIN